MRVPALLTLVACALCSVSASEFPDRECCDPVFPLAALSASVTPDTAAAATPGTTLIHPKNHRFSNIEGDKGVFINYEMLLQGYENTPRCITIAEG